MAKRYTDTDKWGDNWFYGLSPLAKLTFIYITDNCNNAGFYEINENRLSSDIGITRSQVLDVILELEKSCIRRERIIWVKAFIKRQANLSLNPKNNAHKQIMELLAEQYNNFYDCEEYLKIIALLPKEYIDSIENLGAIQGLNKKIEPPCNVMYSNVMSPPEFLNLNNSEKPSKNLTASEIDATGGVVIPPEQASGGFIELREKFRELIAPERNLTNTERGKFNEIYNGYGEARVRDALDASVEEGWKSIASLQKYLSGELKRKSERYKANNTSTNGKHVATIENSRESLTDLNKSLNEIERQFHANRGG